MGPIAIATPEKRPLESGALTTPIRVLVAGGCHVDGYLVGPKHSFPQLTINQLSSHSTCQLRSIGYMRLNSVKVLMGECQSFRPDILVLQLGHYECPQSMIKRFRSLKKRLWRLLHNAAHIWLDGKRNLKRPSQEFLLPCETVFSCESRSQSRNLMRSGSALAAPLKNH
jgi:hypothetical protein